MNPTYHHSPDPSCRACKGWGTIPCDIDGFDTCLACNPEGDHRVSGADLRMLKAAEAEPELWHQVRNHLVRASS